MTDLILTPMDLQVLAEDARRFWVESDARLQLPNTGRAMTENEHRAVSWVQAVAGLLRRKLNDGTSLTDIDGKHCERVPEVKVRLDFPDLEPDTEP